MHTAAFDASYAEKIRWSRNYVFMAARGRPARCVGGILARHRHSAARTAQALTLLSKQLARLLFVPAVSDERHVRGRSVHAQSPATSDQRPVKPGSALGYKIDDDKQHVNTDKEPRVKVKQLDFKC